MVAQDRSDNLVWDMRKQVSRSKDTVSISNWFECESSHHHSAGVVPATKLANVALHQHYHKEIKIVNKMPQDYKAQSVQARDILSKFTFTTPSRNVFSYLHNARIPALASTKSWKKRHGY